jgi:hypothetical protein
MELISRLSDIILNHLSTRTDAVNIFIVGAAFVGTVLAIFFTLLALPLQNILGKYSQDLIRRVIRDYTLIGCFSFLSVVFIFNLILIAAGTTPELTIINIGLNIDSVLILLLLLIHTIYLLDVRNQMNDATSYVQKALKKRMRRAENRQKRNLKALLIWLNLK